jgi:hypothetical protein
MIIAVSDGDKSPIFQAFELTGQFWLSKYSAQQRPGR